MEKVVSWFDQELEQLAAPGANGRTDRWIRLRSRVDGLWSFLDNALPHLRSAAPPMKVVACLVGVRQHAALLAPATAILLELERSGRWPKTSLLLLEAMIALVAWEARR